MKPVVLGKLVTCPTNSNSFWSSDDWAPVRQVEKPPNTHSNPRPIRLTIDRLMPNSSFKSNDCALSSWGSSIGLKPVPIRIGALPDGLSAEVVGAKNPPTSFRFNPTFPQGPHHL